MTTINESRPAEALRADDRRDEEQHDSTKLGGIAGWVDDRTGAAKGVTLLKKVFPDHWSFMLGEIAMYSLIVCLLTGAFLTFWFVRARARPLRRLLHPAPGHRRLRPTGRRSTSPSTSGAVCSSGRSTTGAR